MSYPPGGQRPVYYQPPPVRPTSGLAVTGFILSLVWLCGLGASPP